MSGILRLESLTKGNTLKQGDKTPLKYRLFDAYGEKLNVAGKPAKVRLVYPDFLTIGYEKDGLTVAQDDTVTFTIDNVIPPRMYHVEIIVDDQFIFPSRADESKFTVDKSSLGTETNIIEIVGKDILIQEVKSKVDTELQPLVTSLESAQQAEAQRVIAEQERVQGYQEVQQLIEDGVEPEDGSITTEKLANESVTAEKTNFFKVGKNLFNKDDVILNHHFRTDTGKLLERDGLYVSSVINGNAGETYSLNPSTDPNDFFMVLFLNSDSQPVGFINTANDGASFTLPEGTAKFRFRGNMNYIDGHQLEKGNQSTAYEPFKVFLEDTSIKDKSLSENKLSFQPLIIDDEYINLFDKSSVVDGAVSRTNGGIDANSGYVSSDYIAVNPGDELVQTSVLTGAFYENGRYVSGIGFGQEEVVVPPNANQIRISVRRSEINTHMLIVGNKLPSDYVHHFNEAQKVAQERLFLSREIKSVPDYVRNVIFNQGSIIDLWGDSRTHGSGGTGFNTTPSGGGVQVLGGTAGVYTSPNSHSWANSFRDLMADKYGVTVRNWGEHGRNTNHFVLRSDVLLNQTDNPDLIVMALATNDRHNMATVEQTKANYRIMIQKALDKNIKIVLLSMPPTALVEEAKVEKNFSMYDIDKALRELAHEFEIGFISGYAKSLEYQENQNLPEDGLLADGLHENDLGHDVVYKGVVREMGISYVKSGSR